MDRAPPWILGIPIAASALFFWIAQAPFAAGSDASGYMNFARLLSAGRLTTPPLTMGFPGTDVTDPGLYTPLGFARGEDDAQLIPTYPSGLPLLIAAFGLVLGPDHAVSVVMLLSFVGCGLATVLLGRRLGLSPPYGVLTFIAIMGSQVTLFMGLNPMTDVLSATLLTSCCLLATHMKKGVLWGLATGSVLALAVLVRPTNSFIMLAIPAFIGGGVGWRRWLALACGGLPGLIWLLFLNSKLYGSAFATGYGSILPLLKSAYLLGNSQHFAIWLTLLFTPLMIWPFAGNLLLGTESRQRALPLALWIAPFLVFFSFYAFSDDDWWYTRFLLPAIPAVIIGSALAWQEAARKWFGTRVNRWLPWVLAGLVTLSHMTMEGWKGASGIRRGHIVYQQAGEWVNAYTEAGDGILCFQYGGALLYYTENRPILRYDLLDGRSWNSIVSTALTNKVDLYAVLTPDEVERGEALEARAPGDWMEMKRVRHMTLFKLNQERRHPVPDNP